jgi:hypothetical protein
MSYNEGHINNDALIIKSMTVYSLNKTKVAEALTESNGSPYAWHVTTTKDQKRNTVNTWKGRDTEGVIWYLVKGSYL